MSLPDFNRDDWDCAFVDDPTSFRDWAWRAYDSMRRQRDLFRARNVKKVPRSTGGKRKCTYCAGRAFRGPVVEEVNGKPHLVFACVRCGNTFHEAVVPHAGGFERSGKETTLDRITRYVRRERKDEKGCRAREVAEALGLSPKTMASWLSLLLKLGKIERVEPGLYR